MSFSEPSHVSATTGSAKRKSSQCLSTAQLMTASRTTPTLIVFVIITGPQRNPDSSSQCVPVISPLPLNEKCPAHTGVARGCLPRGRMAVTPVRICGPPSAVARRLRVVKPTSTPGTSVIAFQGPGMPGSGRARERARAVL